MKSKSISLLPVALLFTSIAFGQINTPEVNVKVIPNNYTGVGIDIPQYPFHISGDGGASDPLATLYINSLINHGGIVINTPTGKQSHVRFSENGSLQWQLRVANQATPDFRIYSWGTGSDVMTFQYSTGNVGIGTTSPLAKLDVNQGDLYLSTPNQSIGNGTNLNGLTWRVDDNSAGRVSEEAAAIRFLGTGTWNGSVSPSVLSFETLGSAGGGTIPRMVITNSGKVGIGTTSPSYDLDVSSNVANWAARIINTNTSAGSGLLVRSNNAGTETATFGVIANGAYRFIVKSTGTVGIGTTSPSYTLDVNGSLRATSITESSDRRLKENISPLKTYDLQLITGHQYNLKKDGSFHYGVIAQEVEKIYPHMVSTDEKGFKSVAYNEFIPLLIEKVKEQDKTNQSQSQKLEQQQSEIEALKKEVNELKELLITAKKDEK